MVITRIVSSTRLSGGRRKVVMKPEMHEKSKDFVQSLDRGLAIITAFNERNPRLTLSEVAELTGFTRATARRFLLTLESLNYCTDALLSLFTATVSDEMTLHRGGSDWYGARACVASVFAAKNRLPATFLSCRTISLA